MNRLKFRPQTMSVDLVKLRVEKGTSTVAAHPHSVLLNDQAVMLGTQGIDLENVSITAIMSFVDQDLEVIIQVLIDIAAQFCCDNPRGFRVVAMNSKVDGCRSVDNANLGFFCRWLAFVRLALTKISDDLSGLPKRVVEASVEPWLMIHGNGFCHSRLSLRNRGYCPSRPGVCL